MAIYLIRRTIQSLAFIAFSSLILYTLFVFVLPQGPQQGYQLTLNILTQPPAPGEPPIDPDYRRALEQDMDNLKRNYELDKPWPLNFLAWLFNPSETTRLDRTQREVPSGIGIGDLRVQGNGILTGDFGRSKYVDKTATVTELLSNRWGNTLLLVCVALIASILLAIPIGILGAVRQNSRLDHTFTFLSFLGISVPPFMLGLLFVMGFAVVPYILHTHYGWEFMPYLPPGYVGEIDQSDNWINRLTHLVLPAVTLAVAQTAWLSRHVRFSMLEVLRQDFIRTAWAKGLSARRVVLKHAFRNALIPLITLVGLLLPGMASGAIIVEEVFNYPGLGQLFFKAIGGCVPNANALANVPQCPELGRSPDEPIALVMTIMLVVIVAFSNMLADVLYMVADPRINYNTKARS
ncbi:MAG TPA: ABC transporter permease [Chloroflexia bacterium]|jgi:peptide/nickel transport system permease protein